MVTILKNRRNIMQSKNLVPAFILLSIGLSSASLLLTLLNSIGIMYIGGKETPALVQLENGHSIAVEPVSSHERTPKVINTFVNESLGQLFTWNATSQVDEDGFTRTVVSDEGVSVGKKRVTTRTWRASFGISEDFRVSMLEEIAEMTPDGVFQGSAQSVLNIDSISEPMEVESGKWQVDVVAVLLIFDSRNPQGLAIPFNKTLIVKAVEVAVDPLKEESTPIQKAVYKTRQSGLVIDEMYELGGNISG